MESTENENNDIHFNNRIDLESLKSAVANIKKELAQVIVGQKDFVELLILTHGA